MPQRQPQSRKPTQSFLALLVLLLCLLLSPPFLCLLKSLDLTQLAAQPDPTQARAASVPLSIQSL